jgi:RimJ/RimL family protein N-acetyltransferase
MKQLFLTRSTETWYSQKLCKPHGYIDPQEILYTEKITGHNSISIRRFDTDNDSGFVSDWINRAYSLHNTEDCKTTAQLIDTYLMMLQSDFAQPFIILLDEIPVCLAEIYAGPYHELSLHTNIEEGDYILELLMAPFKKRNRDTVLLILQTCLHYFFSFAEVKRVIGQPHTGDKDLNTAMPEAGFEFTGKLEMAYKTANLYECYRDRFLQSRT